MEDEKIKQLLETALLPAVLELTQTIESMADAQGLDHQKVERALQNDRKETQTMEQSMSLLVETVSKLSEPVKQLVRATNQSNRLQTEQNQLLQTLQDTIAEQTARLSVMHLAVATQSEDPGIKAIYDKLETIGRG